MEELEYITQLSKELSEIALKSNNEKIYVLLRAASVLGEMKLSEQAKNSKAVFDEAV